MNECGVFVDPKNIDLTPVCAYIPGLSRLQWNGEARSGLACRMVWKVMQRNWLQTMCRIKGIGDFFKWRSKVAEQHGKKLIL